MQITRQVIGWVSLVTVTALVATSGIVAQEDPFGSAPEAVDATQPTIDPVATKRRELLELLNRKVDLMNDAELEQALAAARTELTEAQATKRVREAERVLSGVVEEFPQTRAAQQARRMLSLPPVNRGPTTNGFTTPYNDDALPFSPVDRPTLTPTDEKLVPMPESSDAFEEIRPATPKPFRRNSEDSLVDPLSPNRDKKNREPLDELVPLKPAAKPATSGLSRSRLLRTSLPIPNPAPRP